MADHLPDGQCLTRIPADVAGLEPVEAEIGIVRPLLLGIKHRKSAPLGELGPAGTCGVALCRLCAAMQRNDQRGPGGYDRRPIQPRL